MQMLYWAIVGLPYSCSDVIEKVVAELEPENQNLAGSFLVTVVCELNDTVESCCSRTVQ